jgi:hypothetical protein
MIDLPWILGFQVFWTNFCADCLTTVLNAAIVIMWHFRLDRFKSYNASFFNFIKRFAQWIRESFWANGWPVSREDV